ncbi:hypothetical protein GCM10027034_36880 [Ramlibacter solisilvae]|uniref:Uncharacterized protein n=2 Tax=Ramlibacter tataouinensis TaxID=94132 RepID=A0A127JUM4_9BURK|nr:hypothetical protein UC35_13545 [Ramlibacter tataouinensis]
MLEACLVPRDAKPDWNICSFTEADAWWINGANVRALPDGNLRVAPGVPTEKALRLDLAEVDRPIAFATPLAPDFEPHWRFNPLSPASIEGALLQFETWLGQRRAQFVLGAVIAGNIDRMRGGVYHVNLQGRLLAVIDLNQGKAAFFPKVHPETLWEADWNRRPAAAHALPENFVQTTPAELAWTYAQHTGRNVIPAKYRQLTIYYRRVPRVPLRLLRDSQLLILCELSAHPADLDELERRTALPRLRLERDLACLYYAGAVTTQRRNAAAPGQGFRGATETSKFSAFDAETLWDATKPPPQEAIPTAPVMLEPSTRKR